MIAVRLFSGDGFKVGCAGRGFRGVFRGFFRGGCFRGDAPDLEVEVNAEEVFGEEVKDVKDDIFGFGGEEEGDAVGGPERGEEGE